MGAAPLQAVRIRTSAPVTPEALFAANTGWGLKPSVYRERFKRDVMARDSDVILAKKLAQTNGQWEPVDPWAKRKLFWVGDVTGQAVPLSILRDINIFEQVQGRHRSFYLNALRDFAENHPSRKFFRYVVITSGKRLVAGKEDMKARKREMMRKISAWQRTIAKVWDIEALVNVAEHTFDKEERSLHLHFNLMIWPHKALSSIKTKPIRDAKTGHIISHASNAWQDFLQFSRDFLGVYWKECGEIQKLEEVIKYCYKGQKRDPKDHTKRISSDFREDITPAEANWLFHQTFGQRTITAYGGFRAHIKQLRDNRQKLAYMAEPTGEKLLTRVQMPPLPDKTEGGIQETEEDHEGGVKRFENLVRGRTAPMAKASAWAEPGTLIENYTLNPCTPAGQKALDKRADIAAASRAIWDERGAPPPEIALAVSTAWICAASHEAAAAIIPISGQKRPVLDNSSHSRPTAYPATASVDAKPRRRPEIELFEARAISAAYKVLHGLSSYERAQGEVLLAGGQAGFRNGGEILLRFDQLLDETEWQIAVLLEGAPSIVHTTDLTLKETGPPGCAFPARSPTIGGQHHIEAGLTPDLRADNENNMRTSQNPRVGGRAGYVSDDGVTWYDPETGEIDEGG